MDWKHLQNNADDILASGSRKLTKSGTSGLDNLFPRHTGNYLISRENVSYVGEAKDLNNRLKQHSKERSSTFFKNYQKLTATDRTISKSLNISDFEVQTISTNLGRKEMEEFCIVNIPTNLNRFQKGKRDKFSRTVNLNLWDDIQSNSEAFIALGQKQLDDTKSTKWFEATAPHEPGIYWVENPNHGLVYIGESSNVYDRWNTHSKQTYFSALRRHIGENILGFSLKTIKGKKKYFSDSEDNNVTNFLTKSTIKILPVQFGRYELEEFLIKSHVPLLNRKGNK